MTLFQEATRLTCQPSTRASNKRKHIYIYIYMYELKQGCASTSCLITRTRTSTDIVFCDKTRAQMFCFVSNTAHPILPLLSAALFLEKAYTDRMSFGLAECKRNYTDPGHGPRSVVTAIFYRK